MIFSDTVKSNNFTPSCQIRRGALFLGLFVFLAGGWAQTTDFAAAEALFLRDKPAQALPALTAVLAEDPANSTASLYLGLAYYQTGETDKAIDTLRAALPRAGEKKALFAYNLGNIFFAKGSAAFAEQYYSQAIAADGAFASAFLNRAQTRLKLGALAEAVADYRRYLELDPSTAQRQAIEKLIALIEEEFALEKERQLASEKAAQAEAERRQRLLDEVAASLQAAAEQTKGLQAGGEEVLQYDGEFVLE